jgi:hypothetical protein
MRHPDKARREFAPYIQGFLDGLETPERELKRFISGDIEEEETEHD